jgi:asparagine synthase (glutamine-hydrolysing)
MSAICGLIHTRGQPASIEEIQAMMAPMIQRGADGSATWLEAEAAVGHLALHVTEEDQRSCQPLYDAEAQLTLTADARLDNREELCELLGIAPHEGRVLADADLILRAYRSWGESCPTRLLGDFAFAIWDGRDRRLFAACDHVGAKSLYYLQGSGVFAFASEPKALQSLLSPI